jgi:hypothetical protein
MLLAPFLVYFVTSFAVGGVMSGMAALLSHLTLPIGEGGDRVSGGWFFFLAALGGVTTLLWGRLCARRARSKRARLSLSFRGKSAEFLCMIDTGNLLCDPVGGRPVVLIDSRAAGALFDRRLLSLAARGDSAGLCDLEPDIAHRVRLIPAQSATGKGLLLALSPDSARLDRGKGEEAVEVLVAPVPLCLEDSECSGLLPALLIA